MTLDKYKYTERTSTGAVKSGVGRVIAISLENSTAEWKLYDNTAASGTVIGHFDNATVANIFDWPINFSTGLHAELVAGTGFIGIIHT